MNATKCLLNDEKNHQKFLVAVHSINWQLVLTEKMSLERVCENHLPLEL